MLVFIHRMSSSIDLRRRLNHNHKYWIASFLLDSKITVDILWSFGMLSNTRLVDHCFLNISGVYTLVNIYILQKIENIVRHVLASNPPTVKWQVYNPRFNEYGNNTFNVYIFLHNKQTAQLKIIVAANISMLHRIPLEFEYWKKISQI